MGSLEESNLVHVVFDLPRPTVKRRALHFVPFVPLASPVIFHLLPFFRYLQRESFPVSPLVFLPNLSPPAAPACLLSSRLTSLRFHLAALWLPWGLPLSAASLASFFEPSSFFWLAAEDEFFRLGACIVRYHSSLGCFGRKIFLGPQLFPHSLPFLAFHLYPAYTWCFPVVRISRLSICLPASIFSVVVFLLVAVLAQEVLPPPPFTLRPPRECHAQRKEANSTKGAAKGKR